MVPVTKYNSEKFAILYKYLIRAPFPPVPFPLDPTALSSDSSTSLRDTSYTIHQLWSIISFHTAFDTEASALSFQNFFACEK